MFVVSDYNGMNMESVPAVTDSAKIHRVSVSLVPMLSPTLAGRAWEWGYVSVTLASCFSCILYMYTSYIPFQDLI